MLTITKDINKSVFGNFFPTISTIEIKNFDETSRSIKIVGKLINFYEKKYCDKKN